MLHLLGGILSKLQEFCLRTRNVHKELKEGIPSTLKTFRSLKAARGLRLEAQAPKRGVSVATQTDTPSLAPERYVSSAKARTDTPFWWPSSVSRQKQRQ